MPRSSSLGIRGSEMTSPNLSADRMVLLSVVKAMEQGRLGMALGEGCQSYSSHVYIHEVDDPYR